MLQKLTGIFPVVRKIVKRVEIGRKDDCLSCLEHLSEWSVSVEAASFPDFELFCNTVRCRKLIRVQMIPVHRNENPLYFLECNWLLPSGDFPVLYLLVHFTFMVGGWYVFFEFSFELVTMAYLWVDLLVNDLNKIFDILILYLY